MSGRRSFRLVSTDPPLSISFATVTSLALAMLPANASAHVKWFMPYDVATTPMPLHGVLTPSFVVLVTIFSVLIFIALLVDRWLARRVSAMVTTSFCPHAEERILRVGMGAFFVALFATGGTILTPELKTGADWPAWLQLGIAASLLSARSCIVGGVGILVLLAYAAGQYGIFHLADYPMFPGIALYLVLTSFQSERLRRFRMPILYVTLCVSLMWGAIEKWAYPQWTLSLLELRPYLAAGMGHADFLRFAGFVEFSLAFYMLAGFTLVRPAIFVLFFIFAAAILEFGKIDALGHLPIMAPLLAMFIHGPTCMQRAFHSRLHGAFGAGHTVSVAFATLICILFSSYYGLQQAEYGLHSHQSALSANTTPPLP